MLSVQIPLCQANTSYEPGDYEFQFTYHLPAALPATFSLENVYHGSFERFHADIRYTATAWLTAEGSSVSYLAATQPFTIYVPGAAMSPERPVDETLTENLRFLCCLSRGVCQMNASLKKNIHIAGDALELQYQVCNQQSTCVISAVRIELVEEITLMDTGTYTGRKIPRVLSAQEFGGVPAGCDSEPQKVELRLVTPSTGAAGSVPVNATTMSQHFATRYAVRVSCQPFGCRRLKLEVPLIVLHRSAVRDSFSVELTTADPRSVA